MTKTDLRFLAYSRYQMDWFSKQNMELADIWRAMKQVAVERAIRGDIDSDVDLEFNMIWQDLCYNTGFNGKMFEPFDVFLMNEYTDPKYMHSILSRDEFELYCKDRAIIPLSEAEIFAQTHDAVECLKAYACHEAAFRLNKDVSNLNGMDYNFIQDLMDDSERWINGELLDEFTDNYKQTIEFCDKENNDNEEEK